ncbi:MAG: FkbM family methyltransferase [Pseudomonadota bacterium]
MTWPAGTAKAVARSLDTYFRDVARTERMDRLNAEFIRSGDLAFDIGAHLGDRTASYRRLGARVVSVEPQPAMFRALRLLHGRDPDVELRCMALGAAAARVPFYVNGDNPTTSTASRSLIEAAPGNVAWRDQVWDQKIYVAVTTLDSLIDEHGVPDFVKIDVEGYEAELLRGLSRPVRNLSFEFTTLQNNVAVEALNVLEGLGRFRYNYSIGENHALVLNDWVSFDAMADLMATIPAYLNSGDIYARHI